jgi:hypothetical protein
MEIVKYKLLCSNNIFIFVSYFPNFIHKLNSFKWIKMKIRVSINIKKSIFESINLNARHLLNGSFRNFYEGIGQS